MSTKHIVTAGAVIVGIGERGPDQVKVQVYQGEFLPSGTNKEDVAHCLRLDLVAPEAEAEAELSGGRVVDGQAVDGVITVPAGEPSDKWKVAELKQYAASRSVDLGSASSKADILTVLADAETASAAEAKRQAEVDAEAARVAEAERVEAERLAAEQAQA